MGHSMAWLSIERREEARFVAIHRTELSGVKRRLMDYNAVRRRSNIAFFGLTENSYLLACLRSLLGLPCSALLRSTPLWHATLTPTATLTGGSDRDQGQVVHSPSR